MAERKLVGTNEMFKKALAGGYAIGAYNVNNMEILQGIAEAAEETQSPIILQVSAGARKYANQTYLIYNYCTYCFTLGSRCWFWNL